ncbi:hypothetical protein DFQ26_004592 [Actinomortierella ambigua]|nr:hypothetical protein DFQ26_004592 [Actinomortierella ambigua]
MDKRFQQHFDAYTGEPWILLSGQNADTILGRHTISLTSESTWYSFVVDDVDLAKRLFQGEDAKAVEAMIKGSSTIATTTTVDAAREAAFLRQCLAPHPTTKLPLAYGWHNITSDRSLSNGARMSLYLALLRIYSVYDQHAFLLPRNRSESWYTTELWGFLPALLVHGRVLAHQSAEVTSAASTLRKNRNRDRPKHESRPQRRRLLGCKVDGIISCATTAGVTISLGMPFGFELATIEAGKVSDLNSTKCLSDNKRLAKVAKDMHDAIMSRVINSSNRHRLATYALQISGRIMTLYRLVKLPGRYYVMVLDGVLEFPLVWDSEKLINLLVRLVQQKREMEHMA